MAAHGNGNGTRKIIDRRTLLPIGVSLSLGLSLASLGYVVGTDRAQQIARIDTNAARLHATEKRVAALEEGQQQIIDGIRRIEFELQARQRP